MNRRQFITRGALLGGGVALGLELAAEGPAGESRPLRLVFFTDVHARAEAAIEARLERAAAAINAVGADLVIGGGDYLHGGFGADESEIEPRVLAAKRFLDRLEGRVELIAGNHDLVGAGRAHPDPWRVPREVFGIAARYRRFDWGGISFFLLDSVRITPNASEAGYTGGIEAAQRHWIEKELAEIPRERPLVIVTHVPFRSLFRQVGEGPTAALGSNLAVDNANEVLALFRGRRIAAVLQGHLHVDEHLRFNGVPFITGGAVCGAWWRGTHLGTPEGFQELRVSGDAGAAVKPAYRPLAE
ncbi:MAG: metallophosphoesterase family protein [Opitutales bacterium]